MGNAHVGDGAAFEILGTLVNGASKSGHGVHSASSVQNIDVLSFQVSHGVVE
jgi:hypothetical protein